MQRSATGSQKICRRVYRSLHYKLASTFNNKKLEGELYFRKSDNSDMYFFNRYTANLNDGDNKRAQTFYIDNAKGVTFKEAFNLLEGRAVHKELTNKEQEKYQAWLQLDFDKMDKHKNYEVKRFTEGYGYDLAAAVKAFPIKELGSDDEAKKLMASLAKGNVQSVTMVRDDALKKCFGSQPAVKTVNLYDGQMKPLNKEQKQGYMEKTVVKQDATGEVKKTNQQKNDPLLQKKRVNSNKKGVSVT